MLFYYCYLALNCDKKIKPGTIICVEADYNTPMNPPNKTYRIKSGDNCKKIANRLNTTPKILENYNPSNYLKIFTNYKIDVLLI